VNFAYMGQIAVLVLFAQRVLGLGSRGYGLLLASIAVGSVAGGLAAPRLAARVPRATLLVVVAASIGVLSIVVGSAAQTAVAVGGYVATGFAFMVWNVVSVSLRQATTPAAILGRTMSAYRIVAWGTLPLGSLAAGAIAGLGGLRLPFFVGGGLVLVVALASRRLLSAEPLVRPAGEEVPA
jgi:MFS family permease